MALYNWPQQLHSFLFSQKSISIHEEDQHKRIQNVCVIGMLWDFLDEPFKPNFIHEEKYKKNSLNYHHLKFWEWYIFSLSPMTKEKLPLSCERSFIYTSLYLPETKVNKNWNSAAIDQAPESADIKNHNLLPVKFSATDVKASETVGVSNSKKKELANFVPKSFRQNCNLCCLPPCSQHSGLCWHHPYVASCWILHCICARKKNPSGWVHR